MHPKRKEQLVPAPLGGNQRLIAQSITSQKTSQPDKTSVAIAPM
jgi:hypothetical protein